MRTNERFLEAIRALDPDHRSSFLLALRMLEKQDAKEAIEEYVNANEEERSGMLGFILSDGPRRARELRVKHETGIPTADDLERWLS